MNPKRFRARAGRWEEQQAERKRRDEERKRREEENAPEPYTEEVPFLPTSNQTRTVRIVWRLSAVQCRRPSSHSMVGGGSTPSGVEAASLFRLILD